MMVKLTERTKHAGSIQRVSDSFAEKFLIPQGLAVEATLEDECAWQEKANAATLAEKHDEEWARGVKQALEKNVLLITGRKKKDGTYIPVNPMLVAEAVYSQFGIRIPQSMIQLDTNPKVRWRRLVSFKLYENIEATMTFSVVPE